MDYIEKYGCEKFEDLLEENGAVYKWLIHFHNGEAFVSATKFANHFSEDVKQIIAFFKQVSLVAPGSYGLLYVHNDEDRDGFDNAFQVHVLSKENFTLHEDTFLSPYIPIVEENEDEKRN